MIFFFNLRPIFNRGDRGTPNDSKRQGSKSLSRKQICLRALQTHEIRRLFSECCDQTPALPVPAALTALRELPAALPPRRSLGIYQTVLCPPGAGQGCSGARGTAGTHGWRGHLSRSTSSGDFGSRYGHLATLSSFLSFQISRTSPCLTTRAGEARNERQAKSVTLNSDIFWQIQSPSRCPLRLPCPLSKQKGDHSEVAPCAPRSLHSHHLRLQFRLPEGVSSNFTFP